MIDVATKRTVLASELVDNQIALEWARASKDWATWFALLLESARIQNQIDVIDNA